MSLDVGQLGKVGTLTVQLDGQSIDNIAYPAARTLYLLNVNGKWAVASAPTPSQQSPARSGPFKQAFRNNMLFVYGTHGNQQENDWSLAKARYDSEVFWYRGNGSIDVIPDTTFSLGSTKDRNVILYGNAQTNSAWPQLLGSSPVQVLEGKIVVGTNTYSSVDLACLFIRPRPDSDTACVGVVSGSGIVGMRLTDRQAYLAPGIGYPDCLVFGPGVLTTGSAGVRLAGYFGNDWRVDDGDFVTANP